MQTVFSLASSEMFIGFLKHVTETENEMKTEISSDKCPVLWIDEKAFVVEIWNEKACSTIYGPK